MRHEIRQCDDADDAAYPVYHRKRIDAVSAQQFPRSFKCRAVLYNDHIARHDIGAGDVAVAALVGMSFRLQEQGFQVVDRRT
jgi:hypothetical protein